MDVSTRASRLEETRVAENGRFYTRDAFMHHYGQWRGPAEWDRARVSGWDRTQGEAATAGGDTELGADVVVGSAVEPAIEYADSRGALSDEARAVFRHLHRQVADAEQAGGPRTLLTILQNISVMTTDELETCISLYYRSKESPSDASAEPAPPEQRVGVGGCPLGNHGYHLRPNSEPCAFCMLRAVNASMAKNVDTTTQSINWQSCCRRRVRFHRHRRPMMRMRMGY